MTIQNGRYVRDFNWAADRDNSVPISADKFDTEFDGIAEAVNGIIAGTIPIAAGGGATIAEVLAAIHAGVANNEGVRIHVDRNTPDRITLTIAQDAIAAYARYWLWTSSAAVPSAAQFLAGIASQGPGVTLPAGGGRLWLAEQYNDISDIHEVGNENWREFFNDPVGLMIGSEQYYAYGLSFNLDVTTAPTDWESNR